MTTTISRMVRSALAGGMDEPARRDASVISAGPAIATTQAVRGRRLGSRTADGCLSREAAARRLNALTTMRGSGYPLPGGTTTDRSGPARWSHLADTSGMA